MFNKLLFLFLIAGFINPGYAAFEVPSKELSSYLKNLKYGVPIKSLVVDEGVKRTIASLKGVEQVVCRVEHLEDGTVFKYSATNKVVIQTTPTNIQYLSNPVVKVNGKVKYEFENKEGSNSRDITAGYFAFTFLDSEDNPEEKLNSSILKQFPSNCFIGNFEDAISRGEIDIEKLLAASPSQKEMKSFLKESFNLNKAGKADEKLCFDSYKGVAKEFKKEKRKIVLRIDKIEVAKKMQDAKCAILAGVNLEELDTTSSQEELSQAGHSEYFKNALKLYCQNDSGDKREKCLINLKEKIKTLGEAIDWYTGGNPELFGTNHKPNPGLSRVSIDEMETANDWCKGKIEDEKTSCEDDYYYNYMSSKPIDVALVELISDCHSKENSEKQAGCISNKINNGKSLDFPIPKYSDKKKYKMSNAHECFVFYPYDPEKKVAVIADHFKQAQNLSEVRNICTENHLNHHDLCLKYYDPSSATTTKFADDTISPDPNSPFVSEVLQFQKACVYTKDPKFAAQIYPEESKDGRTYASLLAEAKETYCKQSPKPDKCVSSYIKDLRYIGASVWSKRSEMEKVGFVVLDSNKNDAWPKYCDDRKSFRGKTKGQCFDSPYLVYMADNAKYKIDAMRECRKQHPSPSKRQARMTCAIAAASGAEDKPEKIFEYDKLNKFCQIADGDFKHVQDRKLASNDTSEGLCVAVIKCSDTVVAVGKNAPTLIYCRESQCGSIAQCANDDGPESKALWNKIQPNLFDIYGDGK